MHADDAGHGRKSILDLIAVMAALRTPGTGCPWDLEQTFRTIAPYTIEEAYEVADAIERADLEDLADELGDLLLQVVYHARLAEEQGAFAFDDVVDAITRKMIRRHPHVFGDAAARSAGAAKGFWERLKTEEKAAKRAERAAQAHGAAHAANGASGQEEQGIASNARIPTALDGVPVALPALTRAVKLQHRAAKVGFDWPSLAPVLAKIKEEFTELESAIEGKDHVKIAEEYGDLLFVAANAARHLNIDPESALRAANAKFTRRFHRIEELLAARGKTAEQSTLAEMDELWETAKAEEREALRADP